MIKVAVDLMSSMDKVWDCWTNPKHIVKWNSASDDWITAKAENDVKTGGSFNYRMEAKDGSAGFDFEGKYTRVKPKESLEYKLSNDRQVKVKFSEEGEIVRIEELFEAEDQNPEDAQRQGWQAILNNFKSYVESL